MTGRNGEERKEMANGKRNTKCTKKKKEEDSSRDGTEKWNGKRMGKGGERRGRSQQKIEWG